MLRHDPLEETLTPDQARVSPQELARAVAAIETRKDAEAQRHAETISLGEAVHQLDLRMTPEELLAEIESQRVAATSAVNMRHSQPLWRRRLAGIGGALSLAIILALSIKVITLSRALYRSRKALSTMQALTAPRFDLNSSSVLLSSVPNRVPVHCDVDTLGDLARSMSPSQIYVDARQDASKIPTTDWTLIKRNGNVYLAGWISTDAYYKLCNGQSSVMFSTPRDPKVQTVQITIATGLLKPSFLWFTFDRVNRAGQVTAIAIPEAMAKSIFHLLMGEYHTRILPAGRFFASRWGWTAGSVQVGPIHDPWQDASILPPDAMVRVDTHGIVIGQSPLVNTPLSVKIPLSDNSYGVQITLIAEGNIESLFDNKDCDTQESGQE